MIITIDLNKMTLIIDITDRRKADKIMLESPEYEVKTVTSGLKNYFRFVRHVYNKRLLGTCYFYITQYIVL